MLHSGLEDEFEDCIARLLWISDLSPASEKQISREGLLSLSVEHFHDSFVPVVTSGPPVEPDLHLLK